MTARDNIAFGPTIRKTPKDQIRAQASSELDPPSSCGKERDAGTTSPSPQLWCNSGQHGSCLAQAQPTCCCSTSPGALDGGPYELREWLRRLHDEVHVTTIFVTHDQEEAMDIAEQIVVMNNGQIEQTGSATDLYDRPENEFVMGFVGEVNRLGDALIRPHDLDLSLTPIEGGEEANVERVSHLGFEVRVELSLANGDHAWAQVTRKEDEELQLTEGVSVYARPSRARKFQGAEAQGDDGASAEELQVA